ncbi:UCH-domain-containing protein [Exidia glandulosa HHB12029]|uniref:ubiquitinyl hydrolase 1 n=1 Tax=Exidia glandulosa HHB12029 TaxID=1314781 RepID=A0A165N0R9_EXIGL|nr:UCH-domain-containing protein [Exidia glandulosa HHB12029]
MISYRQHPTAHPARPQKQSNAQTTMDKIQARLKDAAAVRPQPPAQHSPDLDAARDPTQPGGSIQDRLRALRDAGMADPAMKRAHAHNPKAASMSIASPSSSSAGVGSPYEFVSPASLGPPSPGPSSFSSLSTSTRRTNLASLASPISPTSASSVNTTFSLKSEQETVTSFPSLDEFETAFSKFPTVPTSPPGAPSTAGVNGFGHAPFASPPPPSVLPSSGPRSSRSQSVASTSRLTSAAPSPTPSVEHHPPNLKPSPVPSTSSTASASRVTRPDVPKTTNLSPKQLKAMLDSSLKVLLLDVRTREEFDRKHINAEGDAVACIEPSILLRDLVSSPAIESALIVGPNEEHAVFKNRDKFSSVVIYDESSDSQGLPTSAASRLIRAIYEEDFTRKLKAPPYFLAGGLKAWESEFGAGAVMGTPGKNINVNGHGLGFGHAHSHGAMGAPPEVPRHTKPVVSPATDSHAHRPSLSSKPSFETHPVIPPPPLNDVLKPSITSPTIASPTPTDASAPPLPNGTAVHDAGGLPSQVSQQTGSTSDARSNPPDSPVADTVRRLNRKPTISRPPSAGPMSAYRRALHDIQISPTTSSSPIQYPSPIRAFSPSTALTGGSTSSLLSSGESLVQAPPAASVSTSPLARRRSDYLEQSQMPYAGGQRPIDYPQLQMPNVIRPPPAAAAPLERQDQRPRIAPLAHTLPPKPPLIASDYPVTTWSDLQVATSGLKNLGNTCYMNSTIQCLSATVPFARFFTEGRWKTAVNMMNPLGTKGQLANAFATLLHEMWHGDLPYRSPYQFRKTVCSSATQFANSDQHDSQEFLSALLDGLHEDLNRILTKPTIETNAEREAELELLPPQIASEQEWQIYQMRNDSLIVDYFQGQFRNRVECLTCHKTSTTYNSFMYLSLPIPAGRGVSKVTLNQCLDHFVRDEVIDKENAWNCPNCKCPRRATTRLSLSRLPPVLLIHLKRFSVKGPFTDKLETVVDFPIRGLDLTNYMPPPLPPGTARPARTSQPLRTDDPRMQVPPYKYDLYGVTNHYGTLTGGHYTAFIASRGGWLHCDDSRISEADPQSLTARAYVLFYRRSM